MRITGNTYTAEVTNEDRLKVDSSSHSPACVAADKQDAYTVIVAADPSATDADFFYLKNTSNDLMKVTRISLFMNSAATGSAHEISIKTGVTGSPTSGTAVTPINLYTGGKAADVTCEQRDGDMALTGGSTVDIIRYEPAVTESGVGEYIRDYEAPIILPPNTALVFNNDVDPVGQDFDMTVWFHFNGE
jgi:hypothetical protein